MSFVGYENSKQFAGAIKQSTQNRSMPPYNADNSGDCMEFQTYEWLTDEELAVIADWADNQAPAGDASKQAPAPVPSPYALKEIDKTIGMGGKFTPEPEPGKLDEYRCFITDAPTLGRDAYFVGYDVIPGNTSIVHHILVAVPKDVSAVADAEALDAKDARLGYPCVGGFSVSADLVGVWAPGSGAEIFPEGLGIKIPADRKLIIQVHYNTANGSGEDQSQISFDLEDSVVKEAKYLLTGKAFGLMNDVIPPGMASWNFTHKPLRTVQKRTTIWSAFPHMHELGVKQKLEIVPDNDSKRKYCGMDVPKWDFNWQYAFFYKNPIVLEPGDSYQFSCTFNTLSKSEPTRWGEGTADEMCLMGFLMTEE
jgi:hypothetical protein